MWFQHEKWKYVYESIYDNFLEEEVYEKLLRFRINKKTGKTQKLVQMFDDLYWETLSPKKTMILKSKITDMGNYYLFIIDKTSNNKKESE